jgi:hypothetical protein
MLLLARSLRPQSFRSLSSIQGRGTGSLPTHFGEEWDELIRAKLVHYVKDEIPAPESPPGTAMRRQHTLVGPMARFDRLTIKEGKIYHPTRS